MPSYPQFNDLAFCATLIDLQPMDLDAHVAFLVRAIVRAHVDAEANVLVAESCDVVDSLVALLGLTAPVLVASVAEMLAAAREESACASISPRFAEVHALQSSRM